MIRRRVIGIDPGATGAVVALDLCSEAPHRRPAVFDMPVVEVARGGRSCREVHAAGLVTLFETLREQEPEALVVIEKVHAMPGQGVTSMFTFGRAAGVVEGVVLATGFRILWVSPTEWRRAMRVRTGKDAGRLRASELLPEAQHYLTRKSDHGRADAILLALYGHQEAL